MPYDFETLRYWLALNRAPLVGPATFLSLLQHFDDIKEIFSASEPELKRHGLKAKSIEAIRSPHWQRVDDDIQWLEHEQNHLLTIADAEYPALLKEIIDPPPLLFVVGDTAVLQQKQIAMVGSRHPTPMGLDIARDFARHLSSQGLVVTSGMALGIDAACHEGALAGAGVTVAVAGTGLDRVYPASHRQLAHRIAEQGALVSEFSPGTPPKAGHFPRRNRIISGLSIGVLVVEAALRSGSLITAKQALEQGREVFAVPGSIHNPQARGCNALIRQGAKLVETAEHIFEELGGFARPIAENTTFQVTSEKEELDPEYKKVLQSVGFEPTSVDTVVERSGLTADAVCSMLLVLELHGLIATTSSGHYCQTC